MIPRIDWQNHETHYLFNEKEFVDKEKLPHLKGHLWVASSGTSNHQKLIALSKEAFLTSAQAVNEHVKTTSKDKWLNLLPLTHVGGLSIYARSHLSSSKVVQRDWKNWKQDQFKLNEILSSEKITLLSLVPTQVFDLVKNSISPPAHLKAVFVGGGALNENLYLKARELEWPILPTYGMTECCSQIATAPLDSISRKYVTQIPKARILPHIEVKVDTEAQLSVKSKSLLTGIALIKEKDFKKYYDPKIDGWYKTQDQVQLEPEGKHTYLSFLRRSSDQVKVLGELVSLFEIKGKFLSFLKNLNIEHDNELKNFEFEIVSHKNIRTENQIDIFVSGVRHALIINLISEFNESLKGFEKIKNLYSFKRLQKTSTGKNILSIY